MAPYLEDFPYKLDKELSKGGEGKVYEVIRISDGQHFAAKMRYNPGSKPELDHDGIF